MKKIMKKIAEVKEHAAKKKAKTRKAAEPVNNGIKKQYLKSKSLCKVTFRLPKEAAPDASVVSVAGDFNEWDASRIIMRKMKNGDFKATVELPRDREYRFKYLIDSNRWENDWAADKYAKNEYGGDDSVVIV